MNGEYAVFFSDIIDELRQVKALLLEMKETQRSDSIEWGPADRRRKCYVNPANMADSISRIENMNLLTREAERGDK